MTDTNFVVNDSTGDCRYDNPRRHFGNLCSEMRDNFYKAFAVIFQLKFPFPLIISRVGLFIRFLGIIITYVGDTISDDFQLRSCRLRSWQ